MNTTYGMVHGGAVRHVFKAVNAFGMLISTCGRVIIAGDSNSRLCKTCARINKISSLVFPTNDAAREMITGCTVDHRHITPESFCERRPNGVKFSGTELSMFRDVLSDWANGAENDACWIGTLAILTDSPKLIREVITPELSKRQGGNGNGGMIDPKNAKPARKPFAGTQPQRELIESLVRQIDEINSEIYPNVSSLAADYTEEYFASLNTRAKVKKDIDDLFKILGVLKSKRTQKRSQERQAEAKANPAEEGFYVMGDTFVTVKWNRARTGQYATVWNHATEEWEWEGSESARVLKMVKAGELARVTEADAIRFGELYGQCMRCHRHLTDPESILKSMGKVCRGKMGF